MCDCIFNVYFFGAKIRNFENECFFYLRKSGTDVYKFDFAMIWMTSDRSTKGGVGRIRNLLGNAYCKYNLGNVIRANFLVNNKPDFKFYAILAIENTKIEFEEILCKF